MAEIPGGGAESMTHGPSSVWRKRIAVLLALTLAAAGLLILERRPASASSAPKVVPAASHPAAVTVQAATLESLTTHLRGAASMLTQTLPSLSAAAKASTLDLAASANRAAGLSQQLTSVATSNAPTAGAKVNTLANQLQTALATTQAKAAAAPVTRAAIPLCTFTIQIGPIFINIPILNIHIQIGPFFIRFLAPCFLSGLPTHIP